MKRLIAATVCAFFVTTAGFADDLGAIHEVSAGIMRAWNSGDSEELAKYFAPDAIGFGADGGVSQGMDANFLKGMFAMGYKANLRFIPGEIRVLGDLAVSSGYLAGMIAVPPIGLMHGTWRASAVWTKREGAWKILHWHHSPLVSDVKTIRPDSPKPPHPREEMRRPAREGKPEEGMKPMEGETSERPGAVAMVLHKVADWERWAGAFREHAPARAELGSMGVYVWRNADDPKEVLVAGTFRNADAFEEMMQSADMKETMREAGVVGEPKVWLVMGGNISKAPETKESRPGEVAVFVRHHVKDIENWHEAFNAHAEGRANAGSKGGFVMTRPDMENEVLVFLFWDDLERARKFVLSEDVKEAMAKAGVVGETEVHFLKMAFGMDR